MEGDPDQLQRPDRDAGEGGDQCREAAGVGYMGPHVGAGTRAGGCDARAKHGFIATTASQREGENMHII